MVIGRIGFYGARFNPLPPGGGNDKRPEIYVVKKGDTLTKIAKSFGLTAAEFKKWTGLKSNNVKVGQEIKLTQAKVPAGKGPLALINQYGMDKESFCALNGIKLSELNSYSAKADEKFYVYKNFKKAKPAATTTKPAKPAETKPSTTTTTTTTNSGSNNKIKLTNGKSFTPQELQTGAIKSAKSELRKLGCDVSTVTRPMPNVVNGKIEATAELKHFDNKSPNKPYEGYVVILNSGHGGYLQENGYFDSGTVASRKDANGKIVPIEEWKIANRYVEELSKKLDALGIKVIKVQGAVGKKQNGKLQDGMAKQQYLQKLLKGEKGSDEVRKLIKNTPKSKMLFMSIHFDDPGNKKAKNCGVNAQSRNGVTDKGDLAFAQNIQNEISKGFPLLKPEIHERGLYVNYAMGNTIPSVLLEVGNINNETIQNSALSSADIDKYTNCLVNAIKKTFDK